MTEAAVKKFMEERKKCFPKESIEPLTEQLLQVPEEMFEALEMLKFQNPNTVLAASILGGLLGVDRFMIGSFGLGLVKLFTTGLWGILYIYDWFKIRELTRNYNLVKLYNGITGQRVSNSDEVKAKVRGGKQGLVDNREELWASAKKLGRSAKKLNNTMYLK